MIFLKTAGKRWESENHTPIGRVCASACNVWKRKRENVSKFLFLVYILAVLVVAAGAAISVAPTHEQQQSTQRAKESFRKIMAKHSMRYWKTSTQHCDVLTQPNIRNLMHTVRLLNFIDLTFVTGFFALLPLPVHVCVSQFRQPTDCAMERDVLL